RKGILRLCPRVGRSAKGQHRRYATSGAYRSSSRRGRGPITTPQPYERMTMRNISIFLIPLLLAGCATQRPVAAQTPMPITIGAKSRTKLVETRYEVVGYREVANPSIRHESHAV